MLSESDRTFSASTTDCVSETKKKPKDSNFPKTLVYEEEVISECFVLHLTTPRLLSALPTIDFGEKSAIKRLKVFLATDPSLESLSRVLETKVVSWDIGIGTCKPILKSLKSYLDNAKIFIDVLPLVSFLSGLNATKAALQSSKIHVSINIIIESLALDFQSHTPESIAAIRSLKEIWDFVLGPQESMKRKRSNANGIIAGFKKRRVAKDI